jgi:hypothetical protein
MMRSRFLKDRFTRGDRRSLDGKELERDRRHHYFAGGDTARRRQPP